jgi:hypothetical protein
MKAKTNFRFSKLTIEIRIWKEIDQLCKEFDLDWHLGSIQVLGASQKAVSAYWEIQGLLRVVEMITLEDY